MGQEDICAFLAQYCTVAVCVCGAGLEEAARAVSAGLLTRTLRCSESWEMRCTPRVRRGKAMLAVVERPRTTRRERCTDVKLPTST